MKPRTALYARVSSARQEREQTIASQLAALERAAKELAVTVPAEMRFIDDGVSGSRLDRPGLDALRDAAADGLLDQVLIFCPDRLARNYVHQQVVSEELEKRGVRVHFVERPVSERPEDRLLVQMQGVIAEYERAKIVERTRRGKLHKVRSGQMVPFSRSPYGYTVLRSESGSTVVIDEVQAEHVRMMYRWVHDEGVSTRVVACRLNELGVAAPRGPRWVASTVGSILKNPIYAGSAIFGRVETVEPKRPKNPGAYREAAKSSHRNKPESQWIRVPMPAIIDEAMQRDVAKQLHANQWFAPRNLKREYLLRGLVVCGGCGQRTRSWFKSDGYYEYMRYTCTPRSEERSERPCKMKPRSVQAADLDDIVWTALKSWIQTPDMLVAEVAAWRNSRQNGNQVKSERVKLQQSLRQLQQQTERLLDAYQRGAISIEELRARRERVDSSKATLEKRDQELAAQELDRERLGKIGDDLVAFAKTLRSGIDTLDFAGRRRLVELLIDRVVVTGDHVAIEHVIPLSGRFGNLRPNCRSDRGD